MGWSQACKAAAPETPAAPRARSARWPRCLAQHLRIHAHPTARRRSHRDQVGRDTAAWACFRGWGPNREAGDHATRVRTQLRASPAPPWPQGREPPPAGHATGRGDNAEPRGAHFLLGARRPPLSRAPRGVRAGPSPTPGPRRGFGTHGARPPLPAGPREPRSNLCSQPSPSPTRRARVCASSFPSSLPRARRTAPVPGSRLLYSAAAGRIHTQTASLLPESPLGREPRALVFQIPAFRCTCLSRYLWGSVGGAEWVENVASLCKRKKTLPPSRRPRPRVTRRETRTGTACGFDLASDEPVGGRGNGLGAHADRHPSRGAGGGPRYLLHPPSPLESPRGVFGTAVTSSQPRAEDRGRARKEDRIPGTSHPELTSG